MRRSGFVVLGGAIAAFALGGCESWRELLIPLLERAHERVPEADGGIAPQGPTIERGERIASLGGARFAVSSYAHGLEIIDLRDANAPYVASELPNYSGGLDLLHRVGDRLLIATPALSGYSGGRTDLPVRRAAGAVVRNVDISDPGRPRVLDELPLTVHVEWQSVLRRAGTEAQLYVLSHYYDEDSTPVVTLFGFRLRDGRLAASARHDLPDSYATISAASPDWIIVAGYERESNLMRLDALHIADGTLNPGPTIRLPESYGLATGTLDGDLLRLRTAEAGSQFIDTWELGAGESATRIGRCTIVNAEGWFGETAYPEPGSLVINASHGAVPQLQRYAFDVQGTCEPASVLDVVEPQVHLQAHEPHRMLGVSAADGASQLSMSLFDAALPSQKALLAQARFDATYCQPPMLHDAGASRATGADGTREYGFIALPCVQEIGADLPENHLHLLSYSDHTLTYRARFATAGIPVTFMLPGANLVSFTHAELLSHDVRAPYAPRERARLALAPLYRNVFRFGDYLVRVRALDYFGPDELQVLPLSAAGQRDPVLRSFAVPSRGEWLQAGELLVHVEREEPSAPPDGPDRHVIQVYDLHDPLQPREAGRLATDAIIASHDPSTGNYGTAWAVDRALVFRHPSNEGSYAFDVVDLRDPDRPQLVRPAFPLSDDGLRDHQAHAMFVSGSRLFVNVYQLPPPSDVSGIGRVDLRVIDFADPAAPVRGARLRLPGQARLSLGADVYAASERFTGNTLTRVSVAGGQPDVRASHVWPETYELGSLHADESGHLYAVLMGPAPPGAPDPNHYWRYLEVYDAQTLERLATLTLDTMAESAQLARGRMLLAGAGVGLVVDVRDPLAPRLEGAFEQPWRSLYFDGEHIFSYGDHGIRQFSLSQVAIAEGGP